MTENEKKVYDDVKEKCIRAVETVDLRDFTYTTYDHARLESIKYLIIKNIENALK